ncbi:DUF6799 domain-containing protein [Deminuibacter soli]|uniref:DUF6799 domain-containing protein n=1 Tax=Deminuibacter soli TaxID=2291815 RepID=A0A3E1NQG7_9BACT|nr:DUF6799 domain-containing protein [Deminuibacter soli]RFM30160.1 hypothetical protein DXN05_04080 [Deminuibacter soli]
MKKLFLLFALLTFGVVAANAQDTSMHKMKEAHHKMKDCIAMKDGKVWVMKDGKTWEMKKDMTLSDGSVVMKDGSVKKSTGETVMLKEGQCIYMNGKISDMKMKDPGGM